MSRAEADAVVRIQDEYMIRVVRSLHTRAMRREVLRGWKDFKAKLRRERLFETQAGRQAREVLRRVLLDVLRGARVTVGLKND
jgi:hypothetical protein